MASFGNQIAQKVPNGNRFRLTLFWGVVGISVIIFGEVVYFLIVKNNCFLHILVNTDHPELTIKGDNFSRISLAYPC